MDWVTFNNNFFNNDAISWFDRKGTLKLTNKLIAEITLSTAGTQGTYVGYKVSIINKDTGKLSSHFFKFDDYMEDRADSDIKYNGFKIVAHCCKDKADWYIYRPTDLAIKGMVHQIMSYINQWED